MERQDILNKLKDYGCLDGKHDFVTVFFKEKYNGCGGEIRWCKNCGSIVQDLLFDGRLEECLLAKTPSVTTAIVGEKLKLC